MMLVPKHKAKIKDGHVYVALNPKRVKVGAGQGRAQERGGLYDVEKVRADLPILERSVGDKKLV